jgi:hypothetical protein
MDVDMKRFAMMLEQLRMEMRKGYTETTAPQAFRVLSVMAEMLGYLEGEMDALKMMFRMSIQGGDVSDMMERMTDGDSLEGFKKEAPAKKPGQYL